jgi:hypothetical protein
VVFDYTLGATFEEQEDPSRSTTPAAGDAVFEGGLDLLLDGLALRARRRRSARNVPISPFPV